MIDTVAWVHLENGRILCARPRGKDVFYIPGGKREGAETDLQTLRREIGEELTARYVDEGLDRVELIYNRYVSPLTQHVWRQTLLPLQQADVIGEGAEAEQEAGEQTEAEQAQSRSDWEYEPEPEELLARLIPEYVTISVYRALLESAASELGARMTAMRNAAENAETIMEDLTLEMNRVRQSEITQQILEVVAGAEALG